MIRQLLAVVFALLIAGVVAVVSISFIRARNTPAMNACVNNLRQLAGAKQQWAVGLVITHIFPCEGLAPLAALGPETPSGVACL